jgi:hypothetical protein
LNATAPQVAAVSLNNYVAGFDDPSKLKKEDIEVIANKLVLIFKILFTVREMLIT